jgi:calcium-activated chloride channel regulator 3/4
MKAHMNGSVASPRLACILVYGVACGAVIVPCSAFGGDHWFSKFRQARGGQFATVAKSDNSAARAEFDVVVSLVNANPNNQDNSYFNARTNYENVIRYWADAVCEQSNGVHKLTTVRIYPNGRYQDSADVVWSMYGSESPKADVAGFGTPGRKITFESVWQGGGINSGNLNYLEEEQELAGYTLGHEWGHYVYGLYDEYRSLKPSNDPDNGNDEYPHSDDVGYQYSIMNNQGRAIVDDQRDFRWLNHSTANGWGASSTAQNRVYGADAWTVLTRSTTDDPVPAQANARPVRIHFTSLDKDGVKPTANDGWIRVDLGANGVCRSNSILPDRDLGPPYSRPDIRWMADALNMEVLVDRSDSMTGKPFEDAKSAAAGLIDEAVEAKSVDLGVLAFDWRILELIDMEALSSANRNTIVSTVLNLPIGSGTALYDAVQKGLDIVVGHQHSSGDNNVGKVVLLLSDGVNTYSGSSSEESVTKNYIDKDVPLFTFGYGSFAPNGILQKWALESGGKFFNAPAGGTALHTAFLQGHAAVTGLVSPTSSTIVVAPRAIGSQTFLVDASLERLSISVSYTGSLGDIAPALYGPTGVVFGGIEFAPTQVGSFVNYVVYLDGAAVRTGGNGVWSLKAANNTEAAIDVSVNVIATPGSEGTYSVNVSTFGGGAIVYPNPAIVTAAVSRGYRITGVNLDSTLTTPSGSATPISLNDMGQSGDALPGDGVYSALVDYNENGVYKVEVHASNGAGNAHYTIAGMMDSGKGFQEAPFAAITENFSRTASTQFVVSGLESGGEDHKSDPAKPDECSALTPDNSQVAGRIDVAGDVDCFRIAGIDTKKGLVVRVARLGLGMVPVLKVYKADGKTLVATGNVENAASEGGYVFLNLTKAALDPTGVMVATVANADGAAGGGIYSVSAGPSVVSDVRPDTDGDGLRDDKDKCTTSDLRPTLVINGFDTGVKNTLLRDGCTLADRVARCESVLEDHGNFPRCVAKLVMDWLMQGHLSGRDASAIHRSLGAGGHGH